VIFFSISVFYSNGQNVKIIGLKQAYKQGEPIIFSIQNRSDSSLFLSSFILEKYNKSDNEWYEQVYDILNYNCGELIGKEGFILKVNSIRKIKWNPLKIDKTCFNYKTNSGRYRLVFKYGISIDEKSKYYLKEFNILK